MTRDIRIQLGNGKSAARQGTEKYGIIDDYVVQETPVRDATRKNGRRDAYDIAREMGLSDPSKPISHRIRMDETGAAETGEKEEKRIRVFVNERGVIQGAEAIESEDVKPRPLTEYKSSFTEEVFTGIAAPHIMQNNVRFGARFPTDWNVAECAFAFLDDTLQTISAPLPQSVFQVIDAAEGNEGDGSSFYTGAGTESAPLRAIALQESQGVLCTSFSLEFEANQSGLDKILSILEESVGFKTGGVSSSVTFSGIRWGGMLQYTGSQHVSAFFSSGWQTQNLDIGQLCDPKIVDNGLVWSKTTCNCKLFLTYFKDGPLDPGTWNASITRMD